MFSDCLSVSYDYGFIVAVKYASNILGASFLLEALQMTLQVKQWSISLKCFAGFDLLLGVLCCIHLISTFLLVSPIYISSQIHIPWYILHAGCNDLSFNWKSSYFSGQPFYSNIKIIISEVIKFFNELFGN